jgi:RNA polymerase sigma-70 factor, ECF subfamily
MFATIDDAHIVPVITACQRGEPGAVARLYDLYADRIYHYVLARTGDPDVAADLTGEVFLRVVEHVPRFKLDGSRPAASLSAWLYRIAANLVADHHRRHRSHPTVSLEDDLPRPAETGNPWQAAERHEALGRLAGALEHLTEEQRQVVICKFGEGMSNAEAATWLGKTEGAIEALQHRALRTLCRLLEPREGKR